MPQSNHYVWKHPSSQDTKSDNRSLCVETDVYYVWKHTNTRILPTP